MGKRWKQWQTLFLGLQNHCRQWQQPRNLKDIASWKKSYDKLDSVLRNTDITLPTKVHIVKTMVFSVVMYGFESWTVKNWCFRIMVLGEEALESPLDWKEIKPVIPKGNQPEYPWKEPILKLKLQYFGHLMWRADSLEKTLMLEKIEDKRRRGWPRMRWLGSITN